jgi:hormone-sensitive lipase
LFLSEISEWNEIFVGLSTICSALIEVHQSSKSSKNLFLECEQYESILTQTLRAINQKPFYGKNIGFQFCESMQPVVKFVVVSMACYFSFYFKDKSKVLKVLRFPISFSKHHTMAKKRAVKCIYAYNNATTEFCRVKVTFFRYFCSDLKPSFPVVLVSE